jgi:protein-S-isoprenylcysteine O-methyltransferase Ste14
MQAQKQTTIDWERVIVVPVIVLLLFFSIAALFLTDDDTLPSSSLAPLLTAYRILLCVFYLLAVALLLLRSAPRARSDRLVPRFAAYLGTFLPFLLPWVGGSVVFVSRAAVALALMILGLSFAIYSLGVLGRSFGIQPQVRQLVQTGPYRFIRHPLYVGEIVSFAGAVLFGPSLVKVGILLTEVVLQAYRAVQEERLLTMTLPEYEDYRRRTKRFVPGLL